MTIALSGRLSKSKRDYADLVAAHGGTFSGTVTKNVTHLVCQSRDAATNAIAKAHSYGIELVGEDFLLDLPAAPQHPLRNPPKKMLGYELGGRNGQLYCSCGGRATAATAATAATTAEVLLPQPPAIVCEHLLQDVAGRSTPTQTDVAAPRKLDAPPRSTDVAPRKLAAPPRLLLAQSFDPDKHNPVGMWVSEKLDGVRAYWDGQHFYSRLGNRFHAPEWFRERLPTDCTLDGELFLGRNHFDETISIVKTFGSDVNDARWHDITYMVFDMPSAAQKPFEERMQSIHATLGANASVKLVEQRQLTATDSIAELLADIERVGGEGLMLRAPRSLYEGKRSKTLLKVKSFSDDEAKVIGYEWSKVQAQVVGSLLVVGRDGTEFKIGSGLTDSDRTSPPAVGTIITYKYQELTKAGKPRFPTYVGIAIDKEF